MATANHEQGLWWMRWRPTVPPPTACRRVTSSRTLVSAAAAATLFARYLFQGSVDQISSLPASRDSELALYLRHAHCHVMHLQTPACTHAGSCNLDRCAVLLHVCPMCAHGCDRFLLLSLPFPLTLYLPLSVPLSFALSPSFSFSLSTSSSLLPLSPPRPLLPPLPLSPHFHRLPNSLRLSREASGC